jgi:hypothetical protein
MLVGSLVHLACELNHGDSLCLHLTQALTLAVQLQAEPALSNLLAFCEELRDEERYAALSPYAVRSVTALDEQIKAHPRIAVLWYSIIRSQ